MNTNTIEKEFNELINLIFNKKEYLHQIVINILTKQNRQKDVDYMLSALCYYFVMNKQKYVEMHRRNEFKYYFISAVVTQLNSKTSRFYKETTLLSNNDNFIDSENIEFYMGNNIVDIYEDNRIDLLEEVREDTITDWYSGELFKMYFDEGYSFRGIAKEANASLKHVFNNIHKSIAKVKEEVNKRNKNR